MSALVSEQPKVLRVHDYLLRAVGFYEKLGRTDLVRDYSDAAELVAITIFGNPPEPTTRRVQVIHGPCPATKDMPGWKRDLLARPLRRVVKVDVFRERDAFTRIESTTWVEHLACGHINNHYPFSATETRARHRRCRECQRVALERFSEQQSPSAHSQDRGAMSVRIAART